MGGMEKWLRKRKEGKRKEGKGKEGKRKEGKRMERVEKGKEMG